MRPPARSAGDDGVTILELVIATAVLAVVLIIVMSFLLSAQRTVTVATARTANDAQAKAVLAVIESDVRFGKNMSVSQDGTALYVASSTPHCTEWLISGGTLTEDVNGSMSTVTDGITGSFATNTSYNGLVTLTFRMSLPGTANRDPGGTSVTETLSAENMPGAVTVTPTATSGICTP